MIYRIAADIVVVVHFLWIVFLIFGALAGRRNTWVKRVHIVGILFACIIQIPGWYCPLTYLEVWLRSMHDPSQRYAGSFIIHYLEKIVYIDLSRNLIFILTVFLVCISAVLYWYRPGKNKHRV